MSPMFLFLKIKIKIDTLRPVLVSQKRVGIHKMRFNIL